MFSLTHKQQLKVGTQVFGLLNMRKHVGYISSANCSSPVAKRAFGVESHAQWKQVTAEAAGWRMRAGLHLNPRGLYLQ